MSDTVTGKVKFFDETKGWGFIARDDGKGDVFLHARELKAAEIETVAAGDHLAFEVEIAKKGVRAKNVARY